MRISRATAYGVFLLAFTGCAGLTDQPAIPVTLAQYDASQGNARKAFPPPVVRLFNLQRAMDTDLAVGARTESLHLAAKLGGNDPAALEEFSQILASPSTGPELQKAALEYLLRSDRPGLATHAVKSLSGVKAGSPLRVAVFEWLGRRGDPSMLADVVKVWAQEKAAGEDEARFRQVVEQIAKTSWEQALLNGINSETFFARGSAVEILAGRASAGALKPKLAAMTPKTEALAAIKAAVIDLDYLPADGMALLSTVATYRSRPDIFKDAARLSRQWTGEYNYQFNIRDVYLLCRLSGDPLRPNLSRAELVNGLNTALSRRVHIARAEGGDDSFSRHASDLTMADLWNLYLINQMLARPRVALALRVMAERDRNDLRTAWGGLVVHENGQAEARLYPPDKDAKVDDLRYSPSRQLVSDSRDAICRFHGHFEKIANSARAGPTADELRDARSNNYYGLIITTVSEAEFCAHYYTPQGIVVSLGRMTFSAQ